MFQVISKIQDLRAIQGNLEEVYQQHQPLSFYSPQYILNALTHFQSECLKYELFFLIYKHKTQLTHYIPLYIDRQQTLRFIFDRHTDYCSCIGNSMSFMMVKELVKLISDHPGIKKIELENLLPDDALLNGLKHFLGSGLIISCYNNHSFVALTADNIYFNQLKSKEKSELKRVQKKNEQFLFRVFANGEVFPEQQILELRNQMISAKSRDSHFFNESFMKFSEALYKAGELEVFSKWNNGRLISASMVLKNKSYRMVWIDLYADVQFINLSAYIDYIQYLEQFPKTTFSFGRGSYDYKAKNFQPTLQNLYNLRYSKSKWDFFFVNFYTIKLFIKRLVKEKK